MPLLAAGTALVAWAGAKPEFDLRQTVLAQVQAVGARSDKPTLNVGCPGERWLTYDDVSFDACLDADPGRLQFCHARRPTLGDIRQLPFASGEFGACLCSHVLEHLPSIADVQRAVRELERTSDRVFILVPGHHLVAIVSPEHHLWLEWRPFGYLVVDRHTGAQQFVSVRDPQPVTPGLVDGVAA